MKKIKTSYDPKMKRTIDNCPNYCGKCGSELHLKQIVRGFNTETGRPELVSKLYCPRIYGIFTSFSHTELEFDSEGDEIIINPHEY